MLKKLPRVAGAIVLLLVLAGAAFAVSARLGAFSIPLKDLRARYETSHSRYVTLDGVQLHVDERGTGPVVLLVHGHYQSLRIWDDWARDLARHHRVIRIDMPPYGLSGPDPSGRYSPQRVEQLIERLVEREKLGPFAMGGISTGSAIAMRYSLAHPDQVRALILANAPLVPLPPEMRPKTSASFRFLESNVFKPIYRPKAFYRYLFDRLIANRAVLTDAFIQESYDMHRKPGNERNLKTFTDALRFEAEEYGTKSKSTAEQLASVTVPTLVMWGDAGTMLPLSIGCKVATTVSPSAPLLIGYPGAGHFLPREAPRAGRDIDWFLTAPERRLAGGSPPVGTREACT
ncbi:alpha/beta fold hydrolase [Novosphingobium sp. BW1]|uniref:alpha/beta fold hydrolase n=1 Tax=Novosphingobium sp. BW1 TaxID=2592621 RepID=UPI0011DE77D8|nr:alpha/beta hydrolase [Novosphingobium sp. BW1]TYC90434.1 alpha/beta hydrolase [Novosphingobium sp. BW1]